MNDTPEQAAAWIREHYPREQWPEIIAGLRATWPDDPPETAWEREHLDAVARLLEADDG